MSSWQTCGQADTEASLLCSQGCDTADISLHGSWLLQLLLRMLGSCWWGSTPILCPVLSMLLPRHLPNGGLKTLPILLTHTCSHLPSVFSSPLSMCSSISLIALQELQVAKLLVHFTEGSPGWHQKLFGREMGSAFSIKSNCVIINVTFPPLFLMFSSSFSGFSFHLSHHSWLHLINLIFILFYLFF